jgi:hypothetical protein
MAIVLPLGRTIWPASPPSFESASAPLSGSELAAAAG